MIGSAQTMIGARKIPCSAVIQRIASMKVSIAGSEPGLRASRGATADEIAPAG